MQGAVRNEQIALFAHQKGKAALVAAQHAFVQSERRGQNVAVFLVADDRALLFERTKDAVYRLALALLRDAQKPRDHRGAVLYVNSPEANFSSICCAAVINSPENANKKDGYLHKIAVLSFF